MPDTLTRLLNLVASQNALAMIVLLAATSIALSRFIISLTRWRIRHHTALKGINKAGRTRYIGSCLALFHWVFRAGNEQADETSQRIEDQVIDGNGNQRRKLERLVGRVNRGRFHDVLEWQERDSGQSIEETREQVIWIGPNQLQEET